MVKPVIERLERCLDVGEIHHPPSVRSWFATEMDLDPKGVPVQARALVTRRHVRQAVRSFEGENFEDIHITLYS